MKWYQDSHSRCVEEITKALQPGFATAAKLLFAYLVVSQCTNCFIASGKLFIQLILFLARVLLECTTYIERWSSGRVLSTHLCNFLRYTTWLVRQRVSCWSRRSQPSRAKLWTLQVTVSPCGSLQCHARYQKEQTEYHIWHTLIWEEGRERMEVWEIFISS